MADAHAGLHFNQPAHADQEQAAQMVGQLEARINERIAQLGELSNQNLYRGGHRAVQERALQIDRLRADLIGQVQTLQGYTLSTNEKRIREGLPPLDRPTDYTTPALRSAARPVLDRVTVLLAVQKPVPIKEDFRRDTYTGRVQLFADGINAFMTRELQLLQRMPLHVEYDRALIYRHGAGGGDPTEAEIQARVLLEMQRVLRVRIQRINVLRASVNNIMQLQEPLNFSALITKNVSGNTRMHLSWQERDRDTRRRIEPEIQAALNQQILLVAQRVANALTQQLHEIEP